MGGRGEDTRFEDTLDWPLSLWGTELLAIPQDTNPEALSP